MTIAVPIDAARRMRGYLADEDNAPNGLAERNNQLAILALVEFAEHFESRALPGMTVEPVAGELREIILTDATLEADTFSLIRLNGRVFVPEVIEVEDDEEEAVRGAIDDAIGNGVLTGTKQLAEALVGHESVTRYSDSHHLHPGAVVAQFDKPGDSWPLFNLLVDTARVK